MSRNLVQYGLALVLAATTTACKDEPLSLGSSEAARTTAVQATVVGSPGDHDAIQQIVNTFDLAWNTGDYVTYAAQYAGAEWVGPDGTIRTDPAAIRQGYQFLFTNVLPGTTRQSIVRNLTFLSGTIAVIDIDARVTGPLPPFIVPWQPGIIRALEKNILIKRGNEWRIVQHQQVIVAAGVQ